MVKRKNRRDAAERRGTGKKTGSASKITVSISQPAPPPQNANMCIGCSAPCCNLRVDLTPFDIMRIVHLAGTPIGEFTELAIAEENDSYAIRINGGLYKLVLKHAGGLCCFQRANSLMCAIEDAKPAICLSYPFSLLEGVPYLRNDILCPYENLMRADRKKMSAEALKAMFYESDRYEESIRAWNSATNGKEDLGRFLKFVSNDLESDRSQFSLLKKGFGRMMLMAGLR